MRAGHRCDRHTPCAVSGSAGFGYLLSLVNGSLGVAARIASLRRVSKLGAEQADVLAQFQAWLRADDCAAWAVRSCGTVAGGFLAFSGGRGWLAGLDGGVIGAFVATLAGYQPRTVEHRLCAVRSLLRFAADRALTDGAVLEAVPAVRATTQARVPSVWEPGDVTKVLEAIDRGNPSGKRDYAIVLLIARLGSRWCWPRPHSST